MADKRIQDLEAASSVQTNDLFVLEQSGAAKSLSGQILVNDLATYLDGHGGISDIVYTPPISPSLSGTLTITMADETEYSVPVMNGRGISGITWVDSGTPGDGQTHTGTIAYNDGTSSTVTIKDGVKGNTGAQTYVYIKWSNDYPQSDADMTNTPSQYIGICSTTASTAPTSYTAYAWYKYKGDKGDTGAAMESIAKTSTSGLTDTYTVYVTGNTPIDTFNVTNGKGIVSFVQTSGTHAAGTTDIYTITYNDGDTSTISVYNGANGLGSVSTVSGIQADGNGDVPQVVSGNGAPTTATVGFENQLYYDLNSGGLYYCMGESGGTYIWFAASSQVSVDSALSTSSTNPVQNKVITGKVGTTALNTQATDLSGAVNEVLTKIPSPQTSGTPENLGTAARGSALTYSRSDHVHNKPTYTKSDVGLGNVDNVQQYSASNPPPYPVQSVDGKTGAVTVLPSGGTTGQVLMKSSATDYATGWGTASDIGAMSKWTLVWTNASPTSNFATQTISLSLSGYEMVAIVFALSTSDTTTKTEIVKVGEKVQNDFILTSYSRIGAFSRIAIVSTTGITFSSTTVRNASVDPSDSQVGNIPLRIYGIKGVQ